MQGTVARLVTGGGFGFIVDPNGEEYFFHRTGLKEVEFRDLTPGVTVWFDVAKDPGNKPGEHLRAVNVTITEDAAHGVENESPAAEQDADED